MEYVGRSVDPERRYNQHRCIDPAKAKLKLIVEDRNLTYTQARIREEELII